MKTKGLVLAVLLIFGLASIAAAECAWVLWVESALGGFGGWDIEDAFEEKAECTTNRMRLMQIEVKEAREMGAAEVKINREQRTLTVVLGKGDGKETHAFRYYCLPDTLAPREKK